MMHIKTFVKFTVQKLQALLHITTILHEQAVQAFSRVYCYIFLLIPILGNRYKNSTVPHKLNMNEEIIVTLYWSSSSE